MWGIAAGIGTYAGVSLALYRVPAGVLIALAVPALMIAPRLMRQDAPKRPSPAGAGTIALTCALSSVVVAIAVLVSHAAGPMVGGSVAAFPLVSMTLAATVTVREGPSAGAHALFGLVRGLPCYLVFCLTAALTTPALGVAALAVAVPASLLAGVVTWRTVPVARERASSPGASTVEFAGGVPAASARTGGRA
jgi:hypothetical protein